jgi:hypothetical protein
VSLAGDSFDTVVVSRTDILAIAARDIITMVIVSLLTDY